MQAADLAFDLLALLLPIALALSIDGTAGEARITRRDTGEMAIDPRATEPLKFRLARWIRAPAGGPKSFDHLFA